MRLRSGRPAQSRAQASGFIVFFILIAIGAVLWGLLNVPVEQIFTATLGQTSDPEATQVIQTRQRIWSNLLLFIIAFATIFILARATIQSMQ